MSNDAIVHAVAGAGGGALATVVTYPLITLSTRAQTTASHENMGNLEAIKSVITKEGISVLYSGLDSALYGMTLTNFIYYYFYEGIKAIYIGNNPSMTTVQSILTGAYSGAATAVITNPVWVVNTRTMVYKEKSSLGVVKEIIQKEGIGTFFSGVGPALLLVINPILNYTIYEQLRATLEKRRPVRALDTMLLGAVSKVIATSVTYPLITIKSRLQLGQGDKSEGNVEKEQGSLVEKLIAIFRSIGFKGLYRGWSLRVTQSALQNAFIFLFKEQLFLLALAVIGILKRLRSRKGPWQARIRRI